MNQVVSRRGKNNGDDDDDESEDVFSMTTYNKMVMVERQHE